MKHISSVLIATTALTSAHAQPVISPIWSGIVLSAPQPTELGIVPKFTYISATWTIPNATQRPGICVGFQPAEQWIGLDGYGGDDVLQAGVGTFVDCATGSAHATAWFGWYPNDFVSAAVVPDVSPGDTVEVFVWVDRAGTGHAYIGDLTTGQNSGTLSTFRPAADVSASGVGYTAEWIIEDNADGAVGMAENAPPPKFGTVTMTQCWASDAQGNGYAPGTPGAAYEQVVVLTGGLSIPSVIGNQVIYFQSAP